MKKVYLLATVMALITGVAVYFFAMNLQSISTVATGSTPTTPVVVALTNINSNTVITEEMLDIRQMSSTSITPGTASTKEEIIGKVAKYPISAGEQIVVKKLKTLGSNDGTDLSYQITGNERAITISVDEITGVAGYIRAGDHVDIITTTASSTGGDPQTAYLLKNVEVLKVSQKSDNINNTEVNSYSTVTLCLSPDDCLTLGGAINLGKSIRLILCPISGETSNG